LYFNLAPYVALKLLDFKEVGGVVEMRIADLTIGTECEGGAMDTLELVSLDFLAAMTAVNLHTIRFLT